MKWSKDSAQKELKALIKEIDSLKESERGSAPHTRWLMRAVSLLEEVFGQNSKYYQSLATLTWYRDGTFAFGGPTDPEGVYNPQAAIDRINHQAYLQKLETARGILLGSLDHLARVREIAEVYQGEDTPPESNSIIRIIHLAEHKLRKAMRELPADERTVQNAFETLLIGADIEYSRETTGIEYSSKKYIADFTVPKIGLAIEVKLCKREGGEKELISQINDDILAYQTRYRNLLFVVYDLGLIRDTELFAGSFEQNPDVVVRVVKH